MLAAGNATHEAGQARRSDKLYPKGLSGRLRRLPYLNGRARPGACGVGANGAGPNRQDPLILRAGGLEIYAIDYI